jgi:hypothetical protein
MFAQKIFAAINMSIGLISTLAGSLLFFRLFQLRDQLNGSLAGAILFYIAIFCLLLSPLAIHGILYFKANQKFLKFNALLIIVNICLYIAFLYLITNGSPDEESVLYISPILIYITAQLFIFPGIHKDIFCS